MTRRDATRDKEEGRTQGTLKVHESKVFDHLELRVGEQVGDDELDCLPRRPSTMVKG